mmetsp:Transcript_71605/g.191010  ORF Transcript_71605/g.191010 Transcript_71605/m.191010 type:complete len:132 (+) Transcript_71605:2-397(+)
MILRQLGLTTATIVPVIVGAVCLLLFVFAFILLSMAAFTSPGAAGAFIQSTLSAGSAALVGGESAPEDKNSVQQKTSDMIYMVLDIPKHERDPPPEEEEEPEEEPEEEGKKEGGEEKEGDKDKKEKKEKEK